MAESEGGTGCVGQKHALARPLEVVPAHTQEERTGEHVADRAAPGEAARRAVEDRLRRLAGVGHAEVAAFERNAELARRRAAGAGGEDEPRDQENACERSAIHSRGASGGSGGCAASTPQL